jgi:regulator of cell morphogenesis and NO signaling
MENITTKTIRQIALDHPITVRVFEEFKIDYCCGGRQAFTDACVAAGIDLQILVKRVESAIRDNRNEPDGEPAENRTPSDLIAYILDKHHTFTAEEIERLTPLMTKVATRHGEHHPELFQLQSVFGSLAESLIPHMRKEESVLFPSAVL